MSGLVTLLLLLLLILSAVYSSSETAFLSLDKNVRSRYVGKRNPMYVLNSLLLANSITVTLFSEIMGETLTSWFENSYWPLSDKAISVIVVFVSTILVVIFGESLPKNLGLAFPLRISKMFSFIIKLNYRLLFWITAPVTKGVELLLQGVRSRNIVDKLSEEEVKVLITLLSNREILNPLEKRLINGLLSLYNTKIVSYMVPRRKIISVDLNDKVQEIWKKISENEVARILVTEKNIDHILGYLRVEDISQLIYNHAQDNILQHQYLIKPIVSLSGSKRIMQAISILSQRRSSIALVTDEYGGTDGLVTMNSLLQGLFSLNQLYDLGKPYSSRVIVQEDNSIIVPAIRTSLRAIRTHFGIEGLSKKDEDSISTVILKELDRFPYEGEIVLIEGLEITVSKMIQNSIQEVKIQKLELDQDEY